MSNWETVFFQSAIDLVLFTRKQLCELRSICTRWCEVIEKIDLVIEKIIGYNIHKRLFYDKDIYDEYYYSKLIVLSRWQRLWDRYNDKCVVMLEYVEDDLEDGDPVISIEGTTIPMEFRMFLKKYKEFPTTKIKLYHPDTLKRLFISQKIHTRENMDEIENIVHFTPLCYSKHYKTNIDDSQFISVLCYVNALDEDILEGLGTFYERFHVIRLDLDDLQDREAHDIELHNAVFDLTERIEGNIGYLEDLDMMTFCECYDYLLKKQKFNL